MAIAWFYGAVLLAPFGVLASAGFGLAKIAEGFNLMFVGGRDGLIRRMIKQNPSYNYGSDPSVRSDMASQAYLHYYQRMDSELHEKALARRMAAGSESHYRLKISVMMIFSSSRARRPSVSS